MDLMDFLLFKETSHIIKMHSGNLHYKTAKCIIWANEFIDTMNTIVRGKLHGRSKAKNLRGPTESYGNVLLGTQTVCEAHSF